jgi:hypothetical protein
VPGAREGAPVIHPLRESFAEELLATQDEAAWAATLRQAMRRRFSERPPFAPLPGLWVPDALRQRVRALLRDEFPRCRVLTLRELSVADYVALGEPLPA